MRWLIALMLVLSPLAGAGSASEPEITDAAADGTTGGQPGCPAGAAACAGPAQVIDITAAWIEESEDSLMFALQTAGSEAHKAYGPMDFDATFTVGGTEFTAGIHLGQSSTAGGDDAVDPRGIATEANIGTDQYEFTVLRSDLGSPAAGDVLENFYVTSLLNNAGAGANSADRAPDTDGVTYTFQLGATAPVPALLNVTSPQLDHANTATEQLDASYSIQWMGPDNVTLVLTTSGNGTVNVTILDPTGGQQFACACTDGANETLNLMSEAGNWTINITYEAFVGDFSLSMGPTVNPAAMSEPGMSDQADHNKTEEEDIEPEGEDSPGLAVPLLVGGLLLARRRFS